MHLVAIVFLVIALRRLSVPVKITLFCSHAFYAVCFAAVAYSLKLLFTRLKSIHTPCLNTYKR